MNKFQSVTFICIAFAAITDARAVTLAFGELPTQPVNNVSLEGVTFGFKVNGVDSTEALYDAFGPGSTVFVQDPSLQGNPAGVLQMDFAVPTATLQFGVAENSSSTLSPGFTVSLFDASLAPINTFAITTIPYGIFTEAQFTYSGVPVSRATVSFSPAGNRFALDNLTFLPVPEPSTLVLAALGAIGLICQRLKSRGV